MKSIASIVFILLLAFTFSSCKKKNYPSDIPKWLKEKIDVMNKESNKSYGIRGKEVTCRYEICRTVEEYTDGSSTYYWIRSGSASPIGYNIYDYNGWLVCEYSGGYFPACGNSGYDKNFVRLIWQE